MKSKFVVATVVALASLTSVGAFAQTSSNRLEGEASTAVRFEPSTSDVTRAQVNADYLQARNSGALPPSAEGDFVGAPASQSILTRAAVRAQAASWARTNAVDGRNAG